MSIFRRFDGFLALAVLALLAGCVVWLRGPPEEVGGVVRVVDGDTLVVSGRRVRLAGIDAPELAQTCERGGHAYPCGVASKIALEDLVGTADILCRLKGSDRFGRALGRCEAGRRDLGAALVEQGFAVSYGEYRAEERAARDARRGLWAGTFVRPDAWRREHDGAGR